ncbi:hypothetical protein F4782DRAFT_280630 [Xylaria castorea]|nr:hypothetical protein F4782DRAFT_280630 [Xylaria castorea]
MMSSLPITMPPQALEGAICFENTLGCFEIQSGPSTQGNRNETLRPPSRSLCADMSLLWDEERPLTVSFLDSCSASSFTNEQVQGFVKDGAYDWTRGTSLRFSFLHATDSNRDRANIRVSFQGSGNWSVLGTTSVESGKPTMNLGFERDVKKAEITRVALHEFGHALGFHHEHSSPNFPLHLDREAIMKDYDTSSDNWFDDNFAKLAMSSTIEASCFDIDSVMMYTIWPSWNKEEACIRGSLVLSKTDRKMVQKWYPPRSIRQSTMRVGSYRSIRNMWLWVDSSRFTPLTQHEGPSIIDNFRCDKPECQERQCDTCYQHTRYLERRVEKYKESTKNLPKAGGSLDMIGKLLELVHK